MAEKTFVHALPFSLPIRVYWEDTDAGGVVYHAAYVRFLERARTEWLRSLGITQQVLRERAGVVFVVRAMQLEFLAPARLDDALEVRLKPRLARRVSMEFEQSIVLGESGKTLIEAQVQVACVRAEGFRPCRLPALLLERLAEQERN